MKPLSPCKLTTGNWMIRTQIHHTTFLISSKKSFNRSDFASSPLKNQQNRVLDSVRIPPTFHDYLRLASSNNTLLLALFTTSACAPCRIITPLLVDIIASRERLGQDKYSALSFTEVELDSPDTSNGNMMDLAVEWGVRSMPTLIGFGGRRSDRVTDRMTETTLMSDKIRMREWIDAQMQKGDPYGPTGGNGNGLFNRLFG